MTVSQTNTTTAVGPTDIATALFDQLEQAWNQADGAAFGAPFAEESDFVNIRGEHHRGRDAIAYGHQAIFDSIYAGSTVSLRVNVAREIAPGTVLAVVDSTLNAPGGPMQGVHNARITAVIVEDHGRRQITAFHNTLVVEGR